MWPKKLINVHTHLGVKDDIDAAVTHWVACGCAKVCVMVTADDLALPPALPNGNRGITNAELVPWMRKYGDVLLGFGLIRLGETPDPADQVDRLKEMGFTGLKFIRPYYAYDDERYFPLYERAQALGMPILFHTGFLVIRESDRANKVSQDKMRAIRLDTLGRAFPELRMMMAHLGNPEYDVGLDICRCFKHIYADFSGNSGSKLRETTLRRVFQPLPGACMSDPDENLALRYFQKLCFATDSPPPPRWIALSQRLMDELQLPEALQEQFWWRNAATWLGLAPETV